MKTTILILTIVFTATMASCQQKTLYYYNKVSWDSLLALKNTATANLTNANATITARNNTIAQLNTTLSARDAQVLLLTDLSGKLQTKVDSVLSVNEILKQIIQSQVNPTDTLVYIKDTIYFKVESNGMVITLSKRGEQVNYQVRDGIDRVNFWYNSGKWEQWFMKDAASWQHFNGEL